MTTLINTGTAATTPPVKINPISISPGYIDDDNQIEISTFFTTTFVATGGVGEPYTFSTSSGSLPTGFILNPDGGFYGTTPASPTTSTFTIQAVDIDGNTGTKLYNVSVVDSSSGGGG
jgi:hypothetical protein